MILKIRRSDAHARSQDAVEPCRIIDNIETVDFAQVSVETAVESDGVRVHRITHPDSGLVELIDQDSPYCIEDFIWGSHEDDAKVRMCRAILNIRRGEDRRENVVYMFATEAFLMNDNGQTIERITPQFK